MAQFLYSAIVLVLLAGSTFASDLKIILNNATGGHMINARIVARYLPRYVENINVVFQAMPGANGVIALNYIYNAAPKDGSEIATVDSKSFMQAVVREPNVKYDMTKMEWLGSFVDGRKEPFLFMAKAGSDRLIGGSEASFSVSHIKLINSILKWDIQNISGYTDQAQTKLAFERGEINLVVYSLTGIRTTVPHWLHDTSIMPLVQYGVGLNRHPNYPNTPTVAELCKTQEDCDLLQSFEATMTLIRAFVAPPKTDKSRLVLLRSAFTSVMNDPDYRVEAKKAGIEVSPIYWREATVIVKEMANTPLDTVSRLKQF